VSNVQLIALIFAGMFLIEIILLIKRDKLHDKQAFIWLMFGIVSVIISLSVPSLNKLSSVLGISYMPTLIFILAFFTILSFLIYQTTITSRQQEKIKTLVQEISLIRNELTEMHNRPQKEV
jgi:hypothetical protein